MIGHNEANRFLPEVLNHLSSIVDLIVFTDDASTDDTLEIASKTPKCHTFASAWPEPHFPVHEGEQRASAWGNLEQFAEWGDWILAIDADEKLFHPYNNLHELVDTTKADVLGVTFFHMWNQGQYRVDKAWRPNVSSRLFRYFRTSWRESAFNVGKWV